MIKLKSDALRFFYVNDKEPHASRGTDILKKYPQVKKLLGPNEWSLLMIVLIVAAQTALAIWLGHVSVWYLIAGAWIFGAVFNHGLFVLIHEATHNLVFKRPWANRLSGIIANLPVAVPMAMAFRSFHLIHHTHMGDHEWDADLPTHGEAKLVGNSSVRKSLWLLAFLFVESLHRPRFIKNAKIPNFWLVLNFALVLGYCGALVYFAGPKTYLYLILSTAFSVGLHPLGARWIQEHFVLREGQETYSYYGPFNKVMFNVGYHNEHHDLPYVAWNRLPKVRAVAPEMYNDLLWHSSYWKLLGQFIFDPQLGMYSRVVRGKIAAQYLTPKYDVSSISSVKLVDGSL